jgi:gluconolactonase
VLFFSDIPANVVMQWRDGADAGVYLNQSGYSGTEPFRGREPGSNGLTIDAVGRLILCQHGDRRLMRVEQGGRKTVLADRFEGKRLNSPNDAVFRSNGDLYFTDPPFGLAKTFDDPRKELRFSGVYRLTAAGELTLLTDELEAPNGVAFSPDETLLYVSNSLAERPVWMIYEVRSDGTLGRGRVFMDAGKWTKKLPGLPDGLKVDRLGHVFAAGPGGVYVFSPEGVHLGTILLGVATSNCAWGGDGADLYITASTAVYRVRLATKGVGF